MLHQPFKLALFAVLASCAIALSGCGGGGSLKKKALEVAEEAAQDVLDVVEEELTPDPEEEETTQFFTELLGQVNEQSDRLGKVQETIARAAQSAPNRGNTTQSSNQDAATPPVTTDRVSVSVGQDDAGEMTYDVENANSAPVKGWTVKSHGEDHDTTLSRTMAEGRRGIELYKVIDRDRINPGTADEKNPDGRLWVSVVTDIDDAATEPVPTETVAVAEGHEASVPALTTAETVEGTHNGVMGTFDCGGPCNVRLPITGEGEIAAGVHEDVTFTPDEDQTRKMPDLDYLAGGIWAYLPNDADEAADYEFGAFADGPQPFAQGNLAALEGTATYEGDATGVYSLAAADTNYFFSATATLTADFGDAGERGSISGRIHDATAPGRAGDFSSVVLHLNSADITDTEGGFFSGGTTVLGGVFNDPAAFTGTWGGRFFGNPAAADADHQNPGSVAGTFGASLNDADGDPMASVLGFFGAYNQPPASQ